MNGFIYFIPNQNALSGGDVGRLGLRSVFGDDSPSVKEGVGPEGVRGILAYLSGGFKDDAEEMAYVRYDKDKQTWLKCNDGKYWVGFWNDRKPGPKELARSKGYGGYDVLLGDGNKWHIPTARLLMGGTAFASKLTLNEEGKWIYAGVEPKFASLCERAETALGTLREGDDKTEMSGDEALALSVDALAANYRVGKWEVAALGLFTDFNAVEFGEDSILGALIDMPRIMAIAKKKEMSESTDGGGKD